MRRCWPNSTMRGCGWPRSGTIRSTSARVSRHWRYAAPSIEDIEYEFKVQKFDDPRHRIFFREDDIVDGALSGLLTGAVEPKDYWEALSAGAKAGQSTHPISGGSIGLPHHGRQTAGPSDDDDGFKRPRTQSESANA